MEKIRIGKTGDMYEIKNIHPTSPNVLRIDFVDKIPERGGDIELYTSGGTYATTLTGYNTVFKVEGSTIYLSNDNSVSNGVSQDNESMQKIFN